MFVARSLCLFKIRVISLTLTDVGGIHCTLLETIGTPFFSTKPENFHHFSCTIWKHFGFTSVCASERLSGYKFSKVAMTLHVWRYKAHHGLSMHQVSSPLSLCFLLFVFLISVLVHSTVVLLVSTSTEWRHTFAWFQLRLKWNKPANNNSQNLLTSPWRKRNCIIGSPALFKGNGQKINNCSVWIGRVAHKNTQFKHQRSTPTQVFHLSCVALRCNVELPVPMFECYCKSVFQTLSWQNSRVITVWVWVDVWC